VVWVSRQGLEQTMNDTPRHYENPRTYRNQVVVSANGALWIQDMGRPTFLPLTSSETTGNSFPVWIPDGKRVIFRTRMGMRWIDADGSGRLGEIPDTSVRDYPGSVSPDGSTLAFTRITASTSADVYALSLHGEPRPHVIVTG